MFIAGGREEQLKSWLKVTLKLYNRRKGCSWVSTAMATVAFISFSSLQRIFFAPSSPPPPPQGGGLGHRAQLLAQLQPLTRVGDAELQPSARVGYAGAPDLHGDAFCPEPRNGAAAVCQAHAPREAHDLKAFEGGGGEEEEEKERVG